ncbi:unnamed protein product [Paramecium sonneborni]|uniref:Cyclic nucleotide-binding domain-containing protein n=1 Tax=Paramecium sonneborni TaxID=65129 RepID=A0A8S1RIL0_9CILI|nr:unnamed protein product [Paramecium sonneborni]
MQQKQSLLINILQCPIKERKAEILQLMRIILQKVDIFQQFQVENIDFEAYDYCLKHLTFESFSKNTVIYEKGNQPHYIYVVICGQVSLYSNDHSVDQTKTKKHSTTVDYCKEKHSVSLDYRKDSTFSNHIQFSDSKMKSLVKLTEFKDWKTFGEQAILDQRLRMNIAVCDIDTSLALLSKEDYTTAVQILEKKKEQYRMNKFKLNPSFQGLNKKLINFMLFSFQSSDYKFRDIIYKQGQTDSDIIYIIKQGEFLVYQDQSEQQIRVRKQIAIMTTGEMFGDYEAFERIPRQFSIQCNSHTASLIIIPLQQLYQKLSYQSEQQYIQQLKSLCQRKNRWYHDFKTSIEQTQEKYQNFLTIQDQKLQNVQNTSQNKIEPPIKQSKEFKQQAETPICVSPITELKNTLTYLTSINDGYTIECQEDQKMNTTTRNKNKNTIYVVSPDQLQPLPKVNLVSSRQYERSKLSTPDRFKQVIKHKMTILKRMHNVSPEESVKINSLQQKTIYVQLPKQVKLEQNIEKQWPIKATLYLNDLDERIRYHSNNQKMQICNSSRDQSLYEQLSVRNDGSEYNSQRTSRMGLLNNVLQYSVTKRGKNKKKRALTLKYREYLESQFQQKTQNSLLYS